MGGCVWYTFNSKFVEVIQASKKATLILVQRRFPGGNLMRLVDAMHVAFTFLKRPFVVLVHLEVIKRLFSYLYIFPGENVMGLVDAMHLEFTTF